MRIKKKYVLKEASIMEGTVLDDLNTFTLQEKKILTTLKKMYYKPDDPEFRWWRLSAYDILEMLHEKWALPFPVAYKLSHVFVLHGDELFKDNRIQSGYRSSEILNLYLDKFVRLYLDTLDGDTLGGGNWNINMDGEVGTHRTIMWDSYGGFLLYLPMHVEDLYLVQADVRRRYENSTILLKCVFDFKSDIDNPTIRVVYRIGDGVGYPGVIIDKAVIDLPDEVTKESMVEWIGDLIQNNIRVLVEDFKFPAAPEPED